MRIFLSYRREDAAAWAGRLHDSLADHLGERNIFQDVVAIRPGEDFTGAIDRALDESDAALAVIGPRWLTVAGADGTPRLAESDDYVRAELLAALAHDLPVVPVLVGGATMPTAADLPAELAPLVLRQAVVLRDAAWHQDVDGLVRGLRGEQPAPVGRRRRRLLVIGLAAVAVVAVAAGGAWLLLAEGESDGESGLTGCPTPSGSEWTDVQVVDTPTGQVDGPEGEWSFEVAGGAQRPSSDGWEVVLGVTATNGTGPELDHESTFYEFVMSGVEFDPTCFNLVAGNNPLKSGSSNDALVGFEVTRDPADNRLALDVEMGGPPSRIELNPG
jgi:hypothetical protein